MSYQPVSIVTVKPVKRSTRLRSFLLAWLACALSLSAGPTSANPLGDTSGNMQIAATPSGVLSTGEPGVGVSLPPRLQRKESDWQENDDRQQSDPQSPAAPPPSHERIEHSTRLPPVDARLQPGRTFDIGLLKIQPVEAAWYRIPRWLAGNWQKKSETILKETDIRSGTVNSRPTLNKRRQSMSFGTQPDKVGNIWHLVKLPIVRKFKMENRVEYKMEVALAFPTLPFDQAFSAARTIVVQVENDTNLIVDTRQEEGLWHMSPISDTDVRCLGSMKSFDMDGTPIGLYRVALKLHRIKPLETSTGENDLRASLASYLSSHGMSGLAPDEVK